MRTLVVYCHPSPDSLCAAALDRVLSGCEAAGHETRVTDLYANGFDPLGNDPDGLDAVGLAAEVDDLRWAEMLVLVYPTWWSGQPAMLTGWIDRVWTAATSPAATSPAATSPAATSPADDGRPRRLTDLRRIVAVTTHGSSKWINALEGESGKRVITRALRRRCARRVRTVWCPAYALDLSTPAERTAFLARVELLMATT